MGFFFNNKDRRNNLQMRYPNETLDFVWLHWYKITPNQTLLGLLLVSYLTDNEIIFLVINSFVCLVFCFVNVSATKQIFSPPPH